MCDTLPPALLYVRPSVRPVSGLALAFALMRITAHDRHQVYLPPNERTSKRALSKLTT